MRHFLLFTLLAAAARAAETVWATPHDAFSSSVGVLGCKINTNRVAYWPMSVDCTNICVQLSYGGRSVYLLRIDQSGGAYDVSYDAWNYLLTGYSAMAKPTAGGATAMQYENVDPSHCANLISTSGHKLPLSAANSMNFVSSCLSQSGSWVSKNYVLYNILDSICSWGYDETCTLNLTKSNQPSCPHTLGEPVVLTNQPVYNIEYPSGDRVLASSGQVTTSKPSLGLRIRLPQKRELAFLVMSVSVFTQSLWSGL
jgi:Cerato-platanin